jgi:hypothetical protein
MSGGFSAARSLFALSPKAVQRPSPFEALLGDGASKSAGGKTDGGGAGAGFSTDSVSGGGALVAGAALPVTAGAGAVTSVGRATGSFGRGAPQATSRTPTTSDRGDGIRHQPYTTAGEGASFPGPLSQKIRPGLGVCRRGA